MAFLASRTKGSSAPAEWIGKTAHYVRQGASGTGSGNDWTNAYTTLPASLTRDHVYYIADGTYGTYTFDDAISAALKIYIVKATTTDHGTDIGWVSTYGDGEALFSVSSGLVWSVQTSYWVFDGQIGEGKDPGGYGFRLYTSEAKTAGPTLMNLGTYSPPGTNIRADNLTIKHIEFDFNNGSGVDNDTTVSIAAYGGMDNVTVSTNYFHDGAAFVMYVGNVTGTGGVFGENRPESNNNVIERNYIYNHGGGGGVSDHWEGFWNTDWNNSTYRYNVFEGIHGTSSDMTGWVMFGGCDTIHIYGNVFMDGTVASNGLIAAWSNDTYANTGIVIYQNTFVDVGGDGAVLNFFHDSGNDSVNIKNNLFYNSGPDFTTSGTVSHNAFGGGDAGIGSNTQTGLTSAIFVDYANDDFHLASHTTAGTALGSPYDQDMDGFTRAAPDRGAYELH